MLPRARIAVAGRKTGVVRTTTVQYIPRGDTMLLVGSNWGRAQHPDWSTNLMAAEQITVRSRDASFTVEVELLNGSERAAAWAHVIAHWPNYQVARNLSPDRQFRLFSLTPRRWEHHSSGDSENSEVHRHPSR
ncbi:MAG: nitroreductase family deazaflavin-dependent oxidoreductase [Mycobacterium sp.]